MKKLFSFLTIWLSAIMCFAQIQVSSTGNVGIGDTGINNYDIEVVFIPTKNRSSKMKGKMKEWD
mgnify:CR=1 FL=1